MKIQKQFIPLILSGEKKYEFRNTNKHEGLYKIKGQYYYLKFFKKVSLFSNPKITIDKETYKWIINNLYYFQNENGEIIFYIYKWKKLENQNLEILS